MRLMLSDLCYRNKNRSKKGIHPQLFDSKMCVCVCVREREEREREREQTSHLDRVAKPSKDG